MNKQSPWQTILFFLLLIFTVVVLSVASNDLWGGKSEQLPPQQELIINEGMTIAQFGQVNDLSEPLLKEIFDLKVPAELDKKLGAYGTTDQVTALVRKKMALAAEHATKNWVKIVVKFGLWFVFLAGVFMFFKKHPVSARLRKLLLFASLLIFGVIMGSDPSPMGTVKDAIHLFGATGAIFPPRMIALTVFLLLVFLANKYICAWGCQVGTLQDLIFRLNQSEQGKALIARQMKVPFVVSNSVRIAFLALFTIFAFLWGMDIIEPIDPFKIYKPVSLGLLGGLSLGAILLAGLFVYRPWCHFLCPFGLTGWLVEKISRIKVSVDYTTCIACQKCATACPSPVMGAILRRDKKTIPDCFACYACREICPTGSISFSARKRTLPPAGHFDRRKKS
ncbi:MAG: ferredoxin family protein [Smithellaceae bacterium]|nr:ferredoxin family protein [Smithellaceae bacterium]